MMRMRSSDGTHIAYTQFGAADATPPIVLHHGFGSNLQLNWVATGIVDACVRSGRAVIALDARGHGESDKPRDPAFYGETRMAQDLAELLDHLRITQLDLFGYSMGAVVSLLFASAHASVRRLVIGGVGEGVVLSGGVDMRVMDRAAVVAALRAPNAAAVSAPGAAAFRVFAERGGADLLALAAQAERMHAAPIALRNIVVPTLVLAGEEDHLAFHPERLAAAMANARAITVPGDHLGVFRHTPFAESALEFLNA